MAERPAYFLNNGKVSLKSFSFEWFSGFAVSQKQKSIESLHSVISKTDSNSVPLEISTKSKNPLGVDLSAFNLKLDNYTLENIYQSSKVFTGGGAYRDLLEVSPKDAKRDARLKNSGELKCFDYNSEIFPVFPKTAFYDYIYIKAVKQSFSEEEIQEIKKYTHFTDIEFNPAKGISTQAKSVAIIRLMLDMYGNIPDLNKNEFMAFHTKYVI
ncbi:MAG: hypothetical protein K2H28_02390 [Ruminococcus sp.]|nr:hypothetical protein [Ruminococcus sp.]